MSTEVEVPNGVNHVKRRPGRPKKVVVAPVETTPTLSVSVPTPKRRGRPPKAAVVAAPVAPVKRRPGRPKKAETVAAAPAAPAKRKAGRPKKTAAAPTAKASPKKHKQFASAAEGQELVLALLVTISNFVKLHGLG